MKSIPFDVKTVEIAYIANLVQPSRSVIAFDFPSMFVVGTVVKEFTGV